MTIRQEKVADRIRDVLAQTLTGENLRDPRVKGITITRVEVTGDLQIAKVFFRSYLDDFSEKEMKEGLKSCMGVFKGHLSKALFMRRIPSIHFYYDSSLEKQNKIEKLFRQIKEDSK